MTDNNRGTDVRCRELLKPWDKSNGDGVIPLDEVIEVALVDLAKRGQLSPVQKLSRDLKQASTTLSTAEARFLVDAYYTMQEDRIRAAHQVRTLEESGEPHEVIVWLGTQTDTLETQIKGALHVYAKSDPVGRWLLDITGIGPVISAGLLAHIDITKAPTVGHIWRFAGLDPTSHWEKKTKRPWNAALKTLCWKIGESFVKTSNNEKSVYGPIYKQRKEYEQGRNDRGELAEQAANVLATKKIDKKTDAYKYYSEGKLPPAHIHARATRYTTKLFLSHLHREMYLQKFGVEPPKPYPIAILGHAHEIAGP